MIETTAWYYSDGSPISSDVIREVLQAQVVDDKWLRRYLSLAYHVASWSRDPSSKVGAVLVGADRKQIAIGYNGFPPGIADTPDRLSSENRETKYALIQHAERNVLDNAAFATPGATLVVTMFPCRDCAKSVISKRISRVVCPPPLGREPWRTSSLWTAGMFLEAGVELIVAEPPVDHTGDYI